MRQEQTKRASNEEVFQGGKRVDRIERSNEQSHVAETLDLAWIGVCSGHGGSADKPPEGVKAGT